MHRIAIASSKDFFSKLEPLWSPVLCNCLPSRANITVIKVLNFNGKLTCIKWPPAYKGQFFVFPKLNFGSKLSVFNRHLSSKVNFFAFPKFNFGSKLPCIKQPPASKGHFLFPTFIQNFHSK